ncbi:Kinesin-like protein 5 [Diplonema papillatum]|nr:Kinesin-like protein 5 [Diplonema papillatum]
MAAPSAGQALRLEEWDHLRIGVREKPLSDEEKARVQVLLKVDADRLIAFYPDSKEGLLYNYDYFFPDDATQTDVYQTVGMEMVELIMNGYSACCLAYGPAGAGKTHTLFGSDQEPGLIQLTTKELLRRIETTPQSLQFSVRLSYWEMSNTEIRDVLSLANTANLPVRKNKNSDGVYIPGLTEVDVTSWAQLDDYVMLGNINRIKLSEQRGARWHGFIKLRITMEDAERPNQLVYTTLTFGHLKGPDRVGQKGAVGDVLRYGSSINQSMTILGAVILHAVEMRRRKLNEAPTQEEVDKIQAKLPSMSESIFTESKLTQVLTGPLSGTVATVMLGCLSTLDYHEATDTLENLQNAQQITTTLNRTAHTTEAGLVWKELQKAEAKLPTSTLAPGHPLTEIEEHVRYLQEKYAALLQHTEPPSLPDKPYKDIEDAPNVAEEDSHNHQKWKQSVVSSKIHGTRNTIYIPTKGAAPVQGCNTYKGQWKAGHKHGFGEQMTALTRYEGDWKDGMRDGKGTLWKRKTVKDEWLRVYKGEWRRDKRHGRGIYWYSNGDVYEGYFEDNMRAAVGKIFLANGDKVEGQWRWDKVEGWATQYLENGDRFEGHWSQGMKEGPGAYYYHSKQQLYKGEWSKDVAKFGTMEDMPKKSTSEKSHFLPRLDLMTPDMVLEKEKEKLAVRRRLEEASAQSREYYNSSKQSGGYAPSPPYPTSQAHVDSLAVTA